MKQDDLDNIVRITHAAYQMRAGALQVVRDQETRLRQELVRIEAMVQQNNLEQTDMFVMQGLGADLLWQAWVTRQKTQVNIRLAQVLVQKENVLQDLRHAFGRAEVARGLHKEVTEKRRKAAVKRIPES